jgi:hypothetical protein
MLLMDAVRLILRRNRSRNLFGCAWAIKKAAEAAFLYLIRSKLFCCFFFNRLRGGTRETLLEFIDTTGSIHNFVFTGIKRVRFRRHLDPDNRIFFAVGPCYLFFVAGLCGGACQKFEIAAGIKKDHFVIDGMGISFHVSCLSFRKGYPSGAPLCRQVLFEKFNIMPKVG